MEKNIMALVSVIAKLQEENESLVFRNKYTEEEKDKYTKWWRESIDENKALKAQIALISGTVEAEA